MPLPAGKIEFLADVRPRISSATDIKESCHAAHSIAAPDLAGMRRKHLQSVVSVANDVQQRLSIAQHTTSVAKMKRLYKLLQRLSIEQRRSVLLRSFQQEQRIALEKWILEHRCSHDVVPKQRTRTRSYSKTEKACRRRDNSQQGMLSSVVGNSHLRIRGITVHRRKHGNFYSALVLFERLELRSREVPTLHIAVAHLKILREVKRALTECMQKLSTKHSVSLESDVKSIAEILHVTMPSVFSEVGAKHGIDAARDLGLYLRVNTPARRWIGASLCGPVFHLQTGFQQGLHGWSLMQVASGFASSSKEKSQPLAWEKLREAYSTMWTSAGRDAGKIRKMIAHLDSLREQHDHSKQAKDARPLLGKNADEASTTKDVRKENHDMGRIARKERLSQHIEVQIRSIVSQWAARFNKALARGTHVAATASRRKKKNRCELCRNHKRMRL